MPDNTTFDAAMKELFKTAERGNDRAQYAYGRARQEGLGGIEKDQVIGAEYVSKGINGGISVETLERVYEKVYRPDLIKTATPILAQ